MSVGEGRIKEVRAHSPTGRYENNQSPSPPRRLRRRRKGAVKGQRPGARYVMLRDLAMVKQFLCFPLVRRSFAWDPAVIMTQVEPTRV